MRYGLKALIVALLLAGPITADATLIDRGGGLIYDDALNITWLKDSNYAQTSGYDADGLMTWAEADAWATNLSYSGLTDWRLPKTVDFGNNGCDWSEPSSGGGGTDCGYSVSPESSEMANLFHATLGNIAWNTYPWASNEGHGLVNTGPFENVQPNFYWSVTSYALDPASRWFFSFGTGLQRQAPLYENNCFFAWAVRDGDVVSSVPEPGTLALLGLGLAGLGLSRRRKAS